MELNVWAGSIVTFLMWTLSLGPIVVNYVLHRPFTFDPNLNRLGYFNVVFNFIFLLLAWSFQSLIITESSLCAKLSSL